jgi:hypothetical protein
MLILFKTPALDAIANILFSLSRSLILSRLQMDDAIRNHIDPSRCSLLIVPIMPDANRNLTNMASAKQKHQETRDTQAPTIGKWQLIRQDGLLVV